MILVLVFDNSGIQDDGYKVNTPFRVGDKERLEFVELSLGLAIDQQLRSSSSFRVGDSSKPI